jgi:hypothetical protein
LDDIENLSHVEVSEEIDATMARLEVLIAVQHALLANDLARVRRLVKQHREHREQSPLTMGETVPSV